MSSLSCKACNEVIPVDSEALLCTGQCGGHFHFMCGGFSEAAFRKLSANKKSKWMCVACQSTKISNTKSIINSTSQDPSVSPDIMEFLKSQYKELKDLFNTSLSEITRSIDYNSNVILELQNDIKDLKTTNKNLQLKCEQLTQENMQIKTEIKELKFAVTELKQYSRRTNLEISNLPESENEHISEVLSKIEHISQSNITEDIIAAHRVPSYNKDRPKAIVVQFKSKDSRDKHLKILKACKLNASNINPRFTDSPVYVNEHLTPELKSLFFDARKTRVEKQFKFCWVKDGKIFLRKNESSRVLRIKSQEDLCFQSADGQI